MSNSGPLAGIRVLDFSRVLAGPLCSMMLADLGADVVKVEHPERGDDTRHWGPPWFGTGSERLSAYFISVNRNKRSITLDLKTNEGRAIARDLATRAHVLVENFLPGQMTEFALGYENLSSLQPALVYASITGFGQVGPYADHPGYDYVIQAMSGLMSITGEEDGPPAKVGVAIADVLAGLNAATGILAALRHAERMGEGQHLDISLMDSQLAALVNVASNYLIGGQVPARYGNRHANIVPYQTFAAQDGEFVVAVGNDRQFNDLVTLLGVPLLSEDPRFSTNPARVVNRDALTEQLTPLFRQHSADEWVEKLLALGIPSGPIQTVAQAFEDPNTRARQMRIDLLTEGNDKPLGLVGTPIHLSLTPLNIATPPPGLGQHSAEVLREWLSLRDDEIDVLRASGALGRA